MCVYSPHISIIDEGDIQIGSQPVYKNTLVKSHLVFIPDFLYYFFNYTIQDMAVFYSDIYPQWNQEQADQLQSFIDEKAAQVKDQSQQFKNLTEEEKTAPLQELIDAGTLSQEQADAVKQILHPQNKRPGARR